MFRKHFCVAVLALAVSLHSLGAASDKGAAENAADVIASRLLEVTNVVLQNHIDPPVRQQMVLSGVRALYRATDREPPKDLSATISQLAEPAKMAEYLRSVQAEFKSLDNIETILIEGALRAVPGQAGLISADDDKIQDQLRANRYVGVGIVLALDEKSKLPQIPKAFADGPAWNAGVQPNDLILEIDGQSTGSKEVNDVVALLRGEAGTEVIMVVRQPDSEETRQLSMTRGRVFIPTIEGIREDSEGKWQYTIDADQRIAYLRVVAIGPSTVHELRQIEAAVRQNDVRGIILDLRDGGGTLHDVVMVADALLEDGIIGHVRSADSTETYKSQPGALFDGVSMAVLINKYSNADRVFLTAALQDHQRATVVGEVTSGETYVNSLVPVPGRGDKIRLATAVMQRGDGTLLLASSWNGFALSQTLVPEHKSKKPGFIMPDHIVWEGDTRRKSIEFRKDPVVAKAIEVLQSSAAQEAPTQETRDQSS
jgi:carboxyl-terminal processing protease